MVKFDEQKLRYSYGLATSIITDDEQLYYLTKDKLTNESKMTWLTIASNERDLNCTDRDALTQ